jgi:hypothetical protein
MQLFSTEAELKKILLMGLIAFFPAVLFAVQAGNIEIMDLPTANTLVKGELQGDFKFYPGGGIYNRIFVGVFDRLTIGGALAVDNIIGTGDVNVNLPGFLAKIRITDDDGSMPAIAIGYEGAGYSDVPQKGAYLAVTKEISLGSVFAQLTGTVYKTDFKYLGNDIDAGTGVEFAVTKEFIIGAEFDGIFGSADSKHINGLIGYFFDPIEIDVGIRYGYGNRAGNAGFSDYTLSRVLRITYVTFF